MKAEIVSIGTELLLGHAVNTDAAFLARELAQLGIDLEHVATVGDNPGRLKACLREALSRSDLVITSGGLGPTEDDLTKETAAKVMGRKLVPDAKQRQDISDYFAKLGREIPESNWKQALVPEGAKVLYNPNGTAPGLIISEGEKHVILLLLTIHQFM